MAFEEVLKRWPDWEVDYANAERARTASVRGGAAAGRHRWLALDCHASVTLKLDRHASVTREVDCHASVTRGG